MNNRNIRDLFNTTAYDSNGDKLGSISEVFVNETSGQPDFVEVNHGLFGLSSSIVPLRGHRLEGDDLRLAFPKDLIKDAPNFDSDKHLDDAEQARIYDHYTLNDVENVHTYDDDQAHLRNDRDAHLDRDHDAHAGLIGTDRERHTDTGSVVRSEEQLNVEKERVETGEVRLRKYVVHDTETVEVPVEREVVQVERTPLDGTEAQGFTGDLTEDEQAITVSEERVNVTKETVPVEKVELKKEVVRDTETVTEDVAREEFDIDGDVDVDRKRR